MLGIRACFRLVLAVGHELIELGTVLGETQAFQELTELALLILEALQRLLAVLVEGPVAARGKAAAASAPQRSRCCSNRSHLPAIRCFQRLSNERQPHPCPMRPLHRRKANIARPSGHQHDEARHHQRDPRGPAEVVELCNHVVHRTEPHVNVYHIYISGGAFTSRQEAAHRNWNVVGRKPGSTRLREDRRARYSRSATVMRGALLP